MKKFCTSLREDTKNKVYFEKEKMSLLTKSHHDAKVCHIHGKKNLKILVKIKIIEKSAIIVIIQINIEVQYIVFLNYNLMFLMKFL